MEKRVQIIQKYDRGVKKEEVITLDVDPKELEIMIQKDYDLRLAEAKEGAVIEKRTAQDIFDEMNRKEYNSWQTHNKRHRSNLILTSDDQTLDQEIIDTIANDSFLKLLQKEADYEDICHRIRQLLKPEQAEMMIAICLKGISVKDYAYQIGGNVETVRKNFQRTKKKLKEIFKKCPI